MSSDKDQWKRAYDLLASALKLVLEGKRPLSMWNDILQEFVFGRVQEVTYGYLEFDHYPTEREFWDTVTGRRDIRLPNFDEIETYSKSNSNEQYEVLSIIATHDGYEGSRDGYIVACVATDDRDASRLRFGCFPSPRIEHRRFLVVRKPSTEA